MKKYLKNIRIEIILEILFSAVESLSMAGIAYIPKIFFDSFGGKNSGQLAAEIILAYCILYGISVAASYLSMLVIWRYAVKFENQVKNDYFRALIRIDDKEFKKRTTSEYISIQSNDIMQIEQDYLTPMITAVDEIIKVIIYGIIMFLGIDARIAAVVLATSLFAAVLPKVTGKFTSNKRLKFVSQLEFYTETISDFLNGFRCIDLRTRNHIEKRHMEELNRTTSARYSYGKSKTISLSLNTLARTFTEIIGISMVVILLCRKEITIGTGVAVFGFISSFADPLEEMFYCFTTMETVKGVKDKVFSILSKDNYDRKNVKKKFNSSLVMNNVSAHSGEFYLKNISCIFEKGKHYAITGCSGSGKSTLLNTLTGYIGRDSGTITIDGEDIDNFDLSQIINFIPQKCHIFNGNFVDNVTMFGSYKDISQKVMDEIHISGHIKNAVEKQIDSKNLSGGEKQIVSYLRARNSDTPILIMDEPFSAVDKAQRKLLIEDIPRMDKTVIMITHDTDDAEKYFDDVIKIKDGKISN